jgi:hypothetical protein
MRRRPALVQAAGVTRKLLTRLEKEAPDLPLRDVAGAAGNTGTIAGISTDKQMLTRERPLPRAAPERDIKEIIASLIAMKVLVEKDEPVVEATAIEDIPRRHAGAKLVSDTPQTPTAARLEESGDCWGNPSTRMSGGANTPECGGKTRLLTRQRSLTRMGAGDDENNAYHAERRRARFASRARAAPLAAYPAVCEKFAPQPRTVRR